MLLNAMVLTLPFPARINELHRMSLTFAIRQTPNTRRGNRVSQNRNMYSKQSQFGSSRVFERSSLSTQTASTAAGALIAKVLPVSKAPSRRN